MVEACGLGGSEYPLAHRRREAGVKVRFVGNDTAMLRLLVR